MDIRHNNTHNFYHLRERSQRHVYGDVFHRGACTDVDKRVPHRRRFRDNGEPDVDQDNFAKDATVSFGGSGITLNSTTVSSATQITANITISGNASALGGHNASVTNPVPAGFTGGGTVTLANGFTVNRRATSTAVNCTPASVAA